VVRAGVSIRIKSCTSSNSKKCHTKLGLLVILLLIGVSSAGCKKAKPPRVAPSKIHAITRELADAAGSSAPSGSDIRVGLQASSTSPDSTDHLDIALPLNGPDSATRSQIVKIQQSLGAVATRNGLTEQPSESRDGIVFLYLKAGVPTHAIHIYIGLKVSQQNGNAGVSSSTPRLAIILDDLGSDGAAAEAIFALPYPLTISVLPNHEHSVEIANEARSRGYQVLLHLPMQSVANERPEAQELHPGMSAEAVSNLVDQFLQQVPGVVGVNNHQGSQATSDSALMSELMPVLRDRHLFYVDSRTTAATVAYDTAQSAGVPSSFRNVPFLDDVAEVAAVRKQLELALRGAREKGEAIAIGHPHPATLRALREVLPKAQTQGVRLVFASELVH
jgi:polysaccharide deacetylase 2 family uncharacterized protein YibQ